MPKLKIVILTTMIAWSGFGLSQTAAATQFSAQAMATTTHPSSVVTDARSFALAKRCTLKRYRRPR
jgi:hypothetical protein